MTPYQREAAQLVLLREHLAKAAIQQQARIEKARKAGLARAAKQRASHE